MAEEKNEKPMTPTPTDSGQYVESSFDPQDKPKPQPSNTDKKDT